MALQQQLELEGTWEEILEHAAELAGRHVHLTVMDPGVDDDAAAEQRSREILALLDEWHRTPLTEEEKRILDEFPAFRKAHPVRFRTFDWDVDEEP